VDEYDKAILDHITDKELARQVREVLRGFYAVIKAMDGNIKFVMLTGITRFSKVSIFSGLNNLEDITMVREYATMLGYTQEELEKNFEEHIESLSEEQGISKERTLEKIKDWYNGYRFSNKDARVYNPFSTMLLLKHKEFKSHWFSTANPKFLIDILQEGDYFIPEIENIAVGREILDNFDIENITLEPLLYQTGYLTIKDARITRKETTVYKLTMPNKEVQISFNDILITKLTNRKNGEVENAQDRIILALEEGDICSFEKELKAIFAGIPYENYVKNNIAHFEGYYASVVYAYLASLGFAIIGEDVTNRGRIDITLKMKDKTYIIEFKVGENALEQIKERKYWEKYKAEEKEIIILGIEFDESQRNVSKVEWEKV
jgi:hypothetical protein